MLLAGTGPNLEAGDARWRELGAGRPRRAPGRAAPGAGARAASEATVFCLPSLWEGQPGAVIEAMAIGVPVITRHPRQPRADRSRQNGLLVPPLDPAQAGGGDRARPGRAGFADAMAAAARRRVEDAIAWSPWSSGGWPSTHGSRGRLRAAGASACVLASRIAGESSRLPHLTSVLDAARPASRSPPPAGASSASAAPTRP